MARSSFLWAAGLAVAIAIAACSTVPQQPAVESVSARTLDEVRAGRKSVASRAQSRPVVALALGGGGLRGYAHVGVLQALEEAGVEVDIVVGTSAGAVIGAAYASGSSVKDLRQLAEGLDVSSLTDWNLSRNSLMRGEALTQWVSTLTRKMPIEAMPRRFGAVATDLDAGLPVLIEQGDAGLAVRASASVPGMMQSVPSTRGRLVDGGITSLVPVRFARAMGADVVIGVDIYCHGPRHDGSSIAATMGRVMQTQNCLVSQAETAEADVLIAPSVLVNDMHSVAQRDAAFQAGYRAAVAALPKLRVANESSQIRRPR